MLVLIENYEYIMNTEIGTYDTKTRLAEILRQVEETGANFTITKHGKPVADLIPSKSSEKSKAETAINNILKSRKHLVTDSDLDEMKTRGRK